MFASKVYEFQNPNTIYHHSRTTHAQQKLTDSDSLQDIKVFCIALVIILIIAAYSLWCFLGEQPEQYDRVRTEDDEAPVPLVRRRN